MALTDWGRAISRCLLCQKKGVILGGGPVSPVYCSVKAKIPLVRRGPRQAGRRGWASWEGLEDTQNSVARR